MAQDAETAPSWSFDLLDTPLKHPVSTEVMGLTGDASDDGDSNSDSDIEIVGVSSKNGSMAKHTTTGVMNSAPQAQFAKPQDQSITITGHQNGFRAGYKRTSSTPGLESEDGSRQVKRTKVNSEEIMQDGRVSNALWDRVQKRVNVREAVNPRSGPQKAMLHEHHPLEHAPPSSAGKVPTGQSRNTTTPAIIPPRSRNPLIATAAIPTTFPSIPSVKQERCPTMRNEMPPPLSPRRQSSFTRPHFQNKDKTAVVSQLCPFIIDEDDEDTPSDFIFIAPTANSFERLAFVAPVPPPWIQLPEVTSDEKAAHRAESARLRNEALLRKRAGRADSVASATSARIVVEERPVAPMRPRPLEFAPRRDKRESNVTERQPSAVRQPVSSVNTGSRESVARTDRGKATVSAAQTPFSSIMSSITSAPVAAPSAHQMQLTTRITGSHVNCISDGEPCHKSHDSKLELAAERHKRDTENATEKFRREAAADARRAADNLREREAERKMEAKRREEEEQSRAWEAKQIEDRLKLERAREQAKKEANEVAARQRSSAILSQVTPQRPPGASQDHKSTSRPPVTQTSTEQEIARERRIQSNKIRNERRRRDEKELLIEPEIARPPIFRQPSAHNTDAKPQNQTDGPVSLSSTAGQARLAQAQDINTARLQADLQIFSQRSHDVKWSVLVAASESLYGLQLSEHQLSLRFTRMKAAFAASGISQALLDRGRDGDPWALQDLARKLKGKLKLPQLSKSQHSASNLSESPRISLPGLNGLSTPPHLESQLRHLSQAACIDVDDDDDDDDSHGDDDVEPTTRPTTSGKTISNGTIAYYLELMQAAFNEEQDRLRKAREPSPIKPRDCIHWGYTVQRREFSADDIEEGADLDEEGGWLFTDEVYETPKEAREAALQAVLLFHDSSSAKCDPDQNFNLEKTTNNDGLPAFKFVLEDGGQVNTRVGRYLRTTKDGIRPTSKEDWLPRNIYYIYQRTVKKTSGDLFEQNSVDDSTRVIQAGGSTSLELANLKAARYWIDNTFRPTTTHLNRRDEQIWEQVEECLAGVDHDRGQMFEMEMESEDGSLKQMVWVERGELIGPRN